MSFYGLIGGRLKLTRLKYAEDDGLATITLHRPQKLNAFDMDMFQELDRVMRYVKKQKTIRVVIVAAEGSDFSTGLDIKGVMTRPNNVLKLLWKWWPSQANLAQRMNCGWRQLPVPVIFAIQGRCWGAGLQMALGGDFRIVSPEASLAIMESRWGLIPDMGGSLALRELVSYDRALGWSIRSRRISADEAYSAGLVTSIANDPLASAEELARDLMTKSPDAIAAIKNLYQYAWHHNDSSLLRREWLLQLRMLLSKNRKIAVRRALGEEQLPFLPRNS